MTIENKNTEALLTKIKLLVGKEKLLIRKVLECLEEIENKKIFLEKGYSSMYAFCTEYLEYSPQEAMTRIQAMRLARQNPIVKDKIESGEISLSVAAKVQSHIARENKLRWDLYESPIAKEEAQSIINKTTGLSVRDSEKVLFTIFPHHESRLPDKVKSVSATQIRLEINLDQKTYEKLIKIKALRSHNHPEGQWNNILEDMCLLALSKWDPEVKILTSKKKIDPMPHGTSMVKQMQKLKPPTPLKRNIPTKIRKYVWIRDQGKCQFIDPLTKKMCGERFGAQIDHVLPWALGGEHSIENLRVLCWGHNQHRAKKTFGKFNSG